MYKITLTEQEFETIQKEMFSYPDPNVRKKMNAVLLVAQDVQRQVICKHLKEESALGEHGADAVLREMKSYDCPNVPSKATVNRILKRHGAFDGRVRKRRKAPRRDGI